MNENILHREINNSNDSQVLAKLGIDKLITFDRAGSIFIQQEQNWYGHGHNDYGQLGLGHTKKTYIPTKIVIPNQLILDVYGSNAYTFFSTKDENWYVCGLNHRGQLGLGHNQNVVNPTLLKIPYEKIKQVITNNGSTFIQTLKNEWYVCGYNLFNQLGTGNNEPALFTMKRLTILNETILEVICNESSTFIHTDSYTWYVCGKNDLGQLGLGHTKRVNVPTKLLINNEKVTKVISNYGSTFMQTQSGAWYTCGNNNKSQLGLSHTNPITSPTALNLSKLAIEQVICNKDYTFFKTEDGKWYCCGNNVYGQLGLGDLKQVEKPIELNINNENIVKIVCKLDATFIQTHSGTWYGCGNNSYGQLGLGYNKQVNYPTALVIGGNEISNVVSNGLSTFVKTKDEQWYVCGYNRLGELGLGHTNDVHQFKPLCIEPSESQQNDDPDIVEKQVKSEFDLYYDAETCNTAFLNSIKSYAANVDIKNHKESLTNASASSSEVMSKAGTGIHGGSKSIDSISRNITDALTVSFNNDGSVNRQSEFFTTYARYARFLNTSPPPSTVPTVFKHVTRKPRSHDKELIDKAKKLLEDTYPRGEGNSEYNTYRQNKLDYLTALKNLDRPINEDEEEEIKNLISGLNLKKIFSRRNKV